VLQQKCDAYIDTRESDKENKERDDAASSEGFESDSEEWLHIMERTGDYRLQEPRVEHSAMPRQQETREEYGMSDVDLVS
jgi:hypothetical protein